MRKSIQILLGEMDAKLTGYAGMLNYRYMNLCIKAEPASLLSITVTDIEGNVYNIEEVANCMQPDKFSFVIVPHDMEMLPFIQKGIAETHPEFKQEVITPKDEDHFFMSNTAEFDKERHIVCTMPQVDNSRYETLKGAVKTLYTECVTEVDKVKGKYTQMLADKTKDLPKNEVDEAKGEYKKLTDLYDDTIKKYRDDKLKEIEESHQNWLADRAEERLNRLQGNKEK